MLKIESKPNYWNDPISYPKESGRYADKSY